MGMFNLYVSLNTASHLNTKKEAQFIKKKIGGQIIVVEKFICRNAFET